MKKVKKIKVKILKDINKPILLLTLLYAILGCFLILDASSISSVLYYKTDSEYYFFIRQLRFVGYSIIASIFVLKTPTAKYRRLSLIASLFFIGALLYVYIENSINTSVNDVTLSMFGGRFQPGEFLKVFLIMYMGSYYGDWANNKNHKKYSFLFPLFLCAVSAIVILLGGDFGSAAIMLALYALVFMSVPSKDTTVKVVKAIACIGLVFSVLVLKFAYVIIPEDVLNKSYRLNRLVYKSPCDRYEENSGYQVCNGYIAIDNGGLFGTGIGESVQKYMYLPASHTDFIFPIVVEELGSLFGVLIILGYVVIIVLVLKVSKECYKLQNSIICYGIAIYFMLHIFVNLGGVLGIIPLTGVPLPFLSYGGSFCIVVISSFAIVQRIHVENKAEERYKLYMESKNE